MNYFYKKHELMSISDILKKLHMTEIQYMLAIRSSLNQTRVFLKRNSLEVGINCYNKDILHLFESNMDIQFVLEEYVLASYIINYISKVESGMSKLLRNAAKEIEMGNNTRTLRDKMRKICNIFLNSNLMPAQEAAYCVFSLSLSKSSRRVIFINTAPQNEHVLMLKSKYLLQQLEPDSVDVYMEDIIQKYCKHPPKLENVGLAEFVGSHYTSYKKKADLNDKENESTIQERQKLAVIRYKRYKIGQDPDNYYREQVLLLLPFRDEIRDVESKNCHELYTKYVEIIEKNRKKFSIRSDEMLEKALEAVKNEQQELVDEDVELNDIGVHENVDILQQGGIGVDTKQGMTRFTTPQRVTVANLCNMLCLLNNDQKQFVMHVLHNFKVNKVPFKIFLSGSAGVGKSTVVNAIYQVITYYFDNMPGSDKDKIVVLCAPSGKAAFLINGVTLHTAFALHVTQFSGNMPALSSDIANSIREKLFV